MVLAFFASSAKFLPDFQQGLLAGPLLEEEGAKLWREDVGPLVEDGEPILIEHEADPLVKVGRVSPELAGTLVEDTYWGDELADPLVEDAHWGDELAGTLVDSLFQEERKAPL